MLPLLTTLVIKATDHHKPGTCFSLNIIEMSGNVELNVLKNPNKQQLTHNNNSSSNNNNIIMDKESPPFDIEKHCWKLDGDPVTRKYWTAETLAYVDKLFDTINKSPVKEYNSTIIQNRISDPKKPEDFLWHLQEEACDIKELLNEIDQNTNTAGK